MSKGLSCEVESTGSNMSGVLKCDRRVALTEQATVTLPQRYVS